MPSPAEPPVALRGVCEALVRELAALDPAGPLATIAATVAELADRRDTGALADPLFTVDALLAVEQHSTVAEPAALLGRVLDLLRRRAGHPTAPAAAPQAGAGRAPTIREALAEYETTGFLALTPNTRRTYRTWLRRLAAAHGPTPAGQLRTGDLSNLITAHLAGRPDPRTQRVRRVTGVRTHITAVQAYRHFWGWLAAMGYADAAPAAALKAPRKPHSAHRRGFTREEAALVRQLCRMGSDPLLDELVVLLAERALLRREEIVLLRLCDLDFGRGLLHVWGKGGKPRTVPMTPGLRTFLLRYVEDRRPADISPDAWLASEERLLRQRRTPTHPHGRRFGRRRIENMWARFHTLAPQLLGDGRLVLHSFRHSGASWLNRTHQNLALVKEALGHDRSTPTDHYVEVTTDELRDALTGYEQWLLGDAAAEAAA